MLELDAIHAYRGPAYVLRGVSLQVNTAEVVCLIGRNGAGKTTTIDCIMGLLPVRSGTITFQGREMTWWPPHQRARQGIGYAPEDTGIFPDLTVAENLQISKWLVGTSQRTATPLSDAAPDGKLLELFPELRRLTERRGLYLSGGEKKMAAIARAMALEPSILLLDEATSALDSATEQMVMERLIAEHNGSRTMIIVAHRISTLKDADRIVVFDQGRLVEQGRFQELAEDPASRFGTMYAIQSM